MPTTRRAAKLESAARQLAAADALVAHEDCWRLVGDAVLCTYDLQAYGSWRLASHSCLSMWQQGFDAAKPWLRMWPGNVEYYVWKGFIAQAFSP